ncbi:MAG: DUF1223 domain-containing protein [Gammaproteobacteria bacterium]|jgi:hypothetical protein
MLFRIAVLPALLFIASLPAAPLQLDSGRQQVTLLELYTSQGCSSCPPAERWLNAYLDNDELWTAIVPVAFHVDYWDYLGWRDAYAAAEYGERQREYARTGRARTVYTPGFFANGREWRGWTRGAGPRRSGREPGRLVADIDAEHIEARFPAAGERLELHVALLGFGIETPVARGENSGRTLPQEFVVLRHAVHTSDKGEWQIALSAVQPGEARRLGIALWVSTPDSPAPLQATGGWLP